MRLTDFDTEDSPKLPQNFINNMKHTSDFDDMSVPYFDRLAVLVMEGIATDEERAEYAKLLSVSEKNQESASIYSKCRLRPDATIQMPDAQGLKRRPRILPLFWKISSAAAVLALGIFGIARYSAMQDAPVINGITESEASPVPREVSCVLPDSQEIAVSVSVVVNKPCIMPACQQEIISAYVSEPDETVPEPTFCEPMVMPEMPTQIPCTLAEIEKITPVYEPADEPESGIMAYLNDKMYDVKESVATKTRKVRNKTARIIDGIPSPVEIVRNDQGEVAGVSFEFFGRTITYRRQL